MNYAPYLLTGTDQLSAPISRSKFPAYLRSFPTTATAYRHAHISGHDRICRNPGIEHARTTLVVAKSASNLPKSGCSLGSLFHTMMPDGTLITKFDGSRHQRLMDDESGASKPRSRGQLGIRMASQMFSMRSLFLSLRVAGKFVK